jgi:hypothetical protein
MLASSQIFRVKLNFGFSASDLNCLEANVIRIEDDASVRCFLSRLAWLRQKRSNSKRLQTTIGCSDP